MLYTRKGDNGTTKLLNCPPGHRVSKSDFVFEVLGTLDELNSSIGYAKALVKKNRLELGTKDGKISYHQILETFQQNLFCIQAELAGSKIHATKEQILYLESIIYEVETLLPPIQAFVLPGGKECGAYLDLTRTIARRAERGLIQLRNKKEGEISEESAMYLNRLSSALYALARMANYQQGCTERNPKYN